MALYLLSVLCRVRVPESNGTAPALAHCLHTMGILLARAEGYQSPTLRMHLSLPGERRHNETSSPLLWGSLSFYRYSADYRQ